MKKQNFLIIFAFILFITACSTNDEVFETKNPEAIAKVFVESGKFNDLIVARNKMFQLVDPNNVVMTEELQNSINEFEEASLSFDKEFSIKKLDKQLFVKAMSMAIESQKFNKSNKLNKANSNSHCPAELSRCERSAGDDFWGSWWTGLISSGVGSVVASVVYLADMVGCSNDYSNCMTGN